MKKYPPIARLKSAELFQAHLDSNQIALPFDQTLVPPATSPFAQTIRGKKNTIGNRFCILPMEGWDGTKEGKPTELTIRRWKRFGKSGAKLIWGGEAVAVRHDGRANPNQLLLTPQNLDSIADLRKCLVEEHELQFGSSNDLSVGLQLTHSGRFARPNQKDILEPRTAYQHPILDAKFNIDDKKALLTDDELKQLIDDFIVAGKLAEQAGFDWIDVKHCHGYLGHELLTGYDRPGDFGGNFENRTRFLRDIVSGVNAITSQLQFGVRLSLFDFIPFKPADDQTGIPWNTAPYRFAFGGDGSGTAICLDEPRKFLELLQTLEIELACTTAGSPYYNPHIQRPATFPPSDGYLPPEDPLIGVARQINATAEIKSAFPEMILVGSGYSYLQDWLPNVGQAVLSRGMVDSVGLGRMVLSYPHLPADVLAGNQLERKLICRTFSDCTTAPRNGLVSGCYPLDSHYKKSDEFVQLAAIKKSNS